MKKGSLPMETRCRCIKFFDKTNDALAGKVDFKTFKLRDFRIYFHVDEEDNEMVAEYAIKPRHESFLQPYLEISFEFEFERYDYFLSSYLADDK